METYVHPVSLRRYCKRGDRRRLDGRGSRPAGICTIDTMRPSMDLDVATALSGQAGLAGLHWLLLAEPAREALREALRGMLDDGAQLGALTLQRAKYKP